MHAILVYIGLKRFLNNLIEIRKPLDHPDFMRIFKYWIRNEWCKPYLEEKNPLIREKYLCSFELVFDLCEKGLIE